MVSALLAVLSSQPASHPAEAATAGANRLTRALVQLAPPSKKGVMVSGPTMSLVMGMAGLGARGKTESEIFASLGLGSLSRDQRIAALAGLRKGMEASSEGIAMKPATSLWLSARRPFHPQFRREAASRLGSEVRTIDFGNPNAVREVNGWVSRATQGRITKLFDSFEADEAAALVSAVWFKGDWEAPFEPGLTKPLAFRLSSGTSVQVPAMNRTLEAMWGEEKGFRWLALPYRGGDLEMVVGLPNNEIRARDALSSALLVGVKDGQGGRVALTLPKWEARFRWTEMEKAFQKLGVKAAFSRREADLTRLSPLRTYLTSVVHETWIKVDEKGTEAAAAGGAVARPTSISPRQPERFVVDRSFFYLIRSRRSGLVAFAGWVEDPRS